MDHQGVFITSPPPDFLLIRAPVVIDWISQPPVFFLLELCLRLDSACKSEGKRASIGDLERLRETRKREPKLALPRDNWFHIQWITVISFLARSLYFFVCLFHFTSSSWHSCGWTWSTTWLTKSDFWCVTQPWGSSFHLYFDILWSQAHHSVSAVLFFFIFILLLWFFYCTWGAHFRVIQAFYTRVQNGQFYIGVQFY